MGVQFSGEIGLTEDMGNGKTYTEVVLDFTAMQERLEERLVRRLDTMNKNMADEFTAVRKDIAIIREENATDRTSVSSLLRRDTIGYVWDSINTLLTVIAVALWTRR